MAQKHLNRAIVNLVAQNHYYYCCSCLRELKIGIIFFHIKVILSYLVALFSIATELSHSFGMFCLKIQEKHRWCLCVSHSFVVIFFYFVNKVFVAWFAIYTIEQV